MCLGNKKLVMEIVENRVATTPDMGCYFRKYLGKDPGVVVGGIASPNESTVY